MGLSFAFNVDPLRGSSTPALGQLYIILATLTFLALDGHLALIEMLAQGFTTLPVGTTGLGSEGAVDARRSGAASCSPARLPSRCPA